MLIDEVLPEYYFAERHSRLVNASKARTRQAVEEWRPEESWLWSTLLWLRGLGRPRGTLREWAESNGFLRLAEDADEVVYGQIGKFWAVNERGALVSPGSPQEFRSFDRPGYAVAAMNFLVREAPGGRSEIITETRVRAIGKGARRRFRLYWTLIRPFSGVLRRAALRGMAARAVSQQRSALARKDRAA